VIHIIKVDLKAKGIRILITPGDPEATLPVKARTTSSFLSNHDLQVAINGDGFSPWHSNSILDNYPKTGDPVDPIGIAISEGVKYSDETDHEPTLYISAANQARFNVQIGKLYNALSGNATIVRNGKVIPNLGDEQPNPRTAVALDRASRHLILVVLDGRQPGYSEGATLSELAEIIIFHGGYNAINLDGGGSSTMVMESSVGTPRVLNSPINNGIPGRQRPVGNHLGIFAKPLDE
jgi:exopolysaccharide biosynthesis protein